jgi:hypothetical protein
MEEVSAVIVGDIVSRLAAATVLASSYFELLHPTSTSGLADKVFLGHFLDSCSTEFLKDDAVARARDLSAAFVPDPQMLRSDTEQLLGTCHGSLEDLARLRLQESGDARFNRRRANLFSHTDEFPHLSMLCDDGGASVLVPDGFVPQPPPEALRKLHLSLGNTVMCHVQDLWLKKKIVVLQEDLIPPSLLSRMHFMQSHWCSQFGKGLGRWLADGTHGSTPESPVLNSPEAFALAEAKYGVATHPTMKEVVSSWCARAHRDGRPLSDYRIWLIDIVNAFGQFSFRPEDVHLLCLRVAINLVAVFLVGFFGLSYCPLIYAIFSRALDQAIALVIVGIVSTYCDDSVGCSPAESAISDFELAQGVCRDMFAEHAVSLPKLVHPTPQAAVLGWWVDLVSELIRPSDRAIRKLAFVFFVALDTDQPKWPLPLCQVVASLATRYSAGVCGMKPFVAPFNHLLAGDQSKFSRRMINSSTRFCVEMWRVAIIMMLSDPVPMSVKFSSFIDCPVTPPDFHVISDAGPDGLGAVVRDANGDIICFSNIHMDTGGARFQNAAEYSGFIFSLMLLIEVVGPDVLRGTTVQWSTDSATALSWVDEGRCSGLFTQRAFMSLTAIVLKYDLKILDCIKIPGVLMGDVDKLSRFEPTPSLPPALAYNAEANPSIVAMCAVIDPTTLLDGCLPQHHEAYRNVHRCVAALGSSFGV